MPSASGGFTATFADTSGQGNGATITGQISGKTLTGTYQDNQGSSGTFTASKP